MPCQPRVHVLPVSFCSVQGEKWPLKPEVSRHLMWAGDTVLQGPLWVGWGLSGLACESSQQVAHAMPSLVLFNRETQFLGPQGRALQRAQEQGLLCPCPGPAWWPLTPRAPSGTVVHSPLRGRAACGLRF